ncbi:MAG: TetR family transcriptional regulator [Halieaceae bacterium]
MATKTTEKQSANGRRTQAERTALSDQKMFEAAIKLIIERGTQKTTLKEIGEMAGYSRGLANYRFGSKDGLMLELFARFDERWKKHLNDYVEDKAGIAGIKSAAGALRDFLKLEPEYMRAMYILWYESLGHESEIRTRLADHHRVYREDATRWIRRGIEDGEISASVDAEQFAVQYCAFIFGTVYQWLVNAQALDLDALFADYESNVEKLLSNS